MTPYTPAEQALLARPHAPTCACGACPGREAAPAQGGQGGRRTEAARSLYGDMTPILQETRRNSPYWPYRSRTEQEYAALLAMWQRDEIVQRWRYEAIRLTLAPRTTITLDWYVVMASARDTRIQLHETKGAWFREDGWQKLKQAAALYPEFRIFLVQKVKGQQVGWQQQWTWKEIPAA